MLRHTLKITTLLLGAALTMAAFSGAAVAKDSATQSPLNQTKAQAQYLISIQTRAPSGYLAGWHGYPVYTLVAAKGMTENMEGTDGASNNAKQDSVHLNTVPCKERCRKAWPPVTVPSPDTNIRTIGTVDESLIGTTKLENGAYQVTFNGYPLYQYQMDMNSPTGAGGQLAGQGVESFGGTWYVLDPQTGEPITAENY